MMNSSSLISTFSRKASARIASRAAVIALAALALAGCAKEYPNLFRAPDPPGAWHGLHSFAPWKSELPRFRRAIKEVLAPKGVNMIILEVNYKFAYQSHPELREGSTEPMNRADARELARFCRELNIRLIPMFNCLGHQSWAKTTFPLLTKYPELDETPMIPKDNPDIYCRSWCPRHPQTNPIVFALMDELIEAFEADAFHVGMDEVFLIASDQCPRCRGAQPGDIFAEAINQYHDHLSREKGLTMLMWGDRLLDHSKMPYGNYESADNGTAAAIEKIPRDIVVCDWHYTPLIDYPSIKYLQEKGFRVWPTGWNNVSSTFKLMNSARASASDKMMGHLFCSWVSAEDFDPVLLGEGRSSKWHEDARASAEVLFRGLAALQGRKDEALGHPRKP